MTDKHSRTIDDFVRHKILIFLFEMEKWRRAKNRPTVGLYDYLVDEEEKKSLIL